MRVEAVEAEVEDAVPALRLQQLDAVVGDEYEGQPRAIHADLAREPLLDEQVRLVLPADASARPAPARPARAAGGRRLGGVPARDRAPRDAHRHLPPARRLRARPAARLRRLPDPPRAGPRRGRVRAAARPGARRRRPGVAVRAARRGTVGRDVFLLTRSARTPAVEAVAAALRTAADAAAQ